MDNIQRNARGSYISNAPHGVYFGEKRGILNDLRKRVLKKDCSWVKPIDTEGHIVVCGGSGSGKTAGIVLPTLLNLGDSSFFAIDIKGDLQAEYDKYIHNRVTPKYPHE